MHVKNTEPCLQWQNISGDPIVWLLAQCLFKGYCEVKVLFLFQLGPQEPMWPKPGFNSRASLRDSLYFKHITSFVDSPRVG